MWAILWGLLSIVALLNAYTSSRAQKYRSVAAWVALAGCGVFSSLRSLEVAKEGIALQVVDSGFFVTATYYYAALALGHFAVEKYSKSASTFLRLCALVVLVVTVSLSLYGSDWLVLIATILGVATCYIVGKVFPARQTAVIRPELVNLRTDTEDMERLERIRATKETMVKPRR